MHNRDREGFTDISKKIHMQIPANQEKRKLTKNWILMMLHDNPKTSGDLIRDGCKVMVFGWEYNEFMQIIGELKNEQKIADMGKSGYALTESGLFEVKKNTIVPILNLTENKEYLTKFIEANRGNCDTQFLALLSTHTEKEKERMILNFGLKSFDKIATIIQTAIQWGVQNAPSV